MRYRPSPITIDDIGRDLDDNRFTVVDLVEAHLARIKEVNHVFNAVLQVSPDVLAIAREMNREIQERGRRGYLHGVPILVKDNIYINKEMGGSAGSFAFLGSCLPREATVISRLRKAGAIILGVAMALGLAPGSLGTETYGSIVLPSQKNNVVGFRTTTGLVPRDGVIPLCDWQDTIGPMTRTVKDAAHILTVIAGKSPYDDATHSIPMKNIPDYSQASAGSNLSGIRLGVPRRAIPSTNPIVLAKFEQTLNKLASLGATIVDNRRRALEAEFKASINRWCGSLVTNPQGIKSLDDLIDFIKKDPREIFPERNIERLLGAQESPGVDALITQNALKKMLRCCADEGILAALKRDKLDALVFPNEAGFPVFAVPLGFYPPGTAVKKTKGEQIDIAPNIPYGIEFSAEPYSEFKLTRISHAFQISWSLPEITPDLLPKTELTAASNSIAPLGTLFCSFIEYKSPLITQSYVDSLFGNSASFFS
ncbi:amidase signature domain-containing protein [Podospora fimiseda]|uniref:Amidase signature domain-containing protein n=1 Tax=Podospora fimiseda TaxID=252190 RepID=A0AAN6YPJ8_9PEZI|nr:amidase signature domain-containing protein [Podospora fimiseda]